MKDEKNALTLTLRRASYDTSRVRVALTMRDGPLLVSRTPKRMSIRGLWRPIILASLENWVVRPTTVPLLLELWSNRNVTWVSFSIWLFIGREKLRNALADMNLDNYGLVLSLFSTLGNFPHNDFTSLPSRLLADSPWRQCWSQL